MTDVIQQTRVDTTSGSSGSDHRLDSNPTAEARYVARYGG